MRISSALAISFAAYGVAAYYYIEEYEITTSTTNPVSTPAPSIAALNSNGTKELALFKRMGGSKKKEVCQAEAYLHDFITFLRSFVNERDFDREGFEAHERNLQRQLSEVCTWAQGIQNTPHLTAQLGHVKNLLSAMAHSIETLKFFSLSTRDHSLVRSIIYLNVSLMTLFNSNGEPDTSIEGLQGIVSRFSVAVDFWAEAFDGLEGVSETVREVFQTELREVRYSIHLLTGYQNNIVEHIQRANGTVGT